MVAKNKFTRVLPDSRVEESIKLPFAFCTFPPKGLY